MKPFFSFHTIMQYSYLSFRKDTDKSQQISVYFKQIARFDATNKFIKFAILKYIHISTKSNVTYNEHRGLGKLPTSKPLPLSINYHAKLDIYLKE